MNQIEILPNSVVEWVKGEKIGDTEIVESVDENFIIFKGGGRINIAIKDEYLSYIGQAVGDGPFVKQKNDLYELKKSNSITNLNLQKSSNDTFYTDILSKAKRDTKTNLNVDFNFDFISKDKVKMLIDLYGDDMKDSLIDYIRNIINEDIIKHTINVYVENNYFNHEQH